MPLESTRDTWVGGMVRVVMEVTLEVDGVGVSSSRSPHLNVEPLIVVVSVLFIINCDLIQGAFQPRELYFMKWSFLLPPEQQQCDLCWGWKIQKMRVSKEFKSKRLGERFDIFSTK